MDLESAEVKRKKLFSKIKRAIIVVALLLWYSFFLFHPIDLIPSDLGRHIKNGEILLSSWKDAAALLHTNFYSSTYPDFPFVNHHWASGIVFFALYRLGGFSLLSVLLVVLSLATLGLLFDVARKAGGFFTASLLTFLLIPLLAERTEVRPEIFTYFFTAIFWWTLWHYRNGRFSARILFLLPFVQILWMNLHIYFFLGPILTGIFWLDALFSKEKNRQTARALTIALTAVTLINLVNPSSLAGVLYPLRIFNNYGLLVAENQSVAAVGAHDPLYTNLALFKFAFIGLLVAFAFVFFKRRRQFPVGYFILMIFVSFLAWQSVRNLTLFALLALPIGAELVRIILPKPLLSKKYLLVGLAALTVFITVLISWKNLVDTGKVLGFGLRQGNSAVADFILKNNIQGPLFNDFDIGGYAIFYLYPKLRPFTDNRPEAYPAKFFTETYVPMQTDEKIWAVKQKEYGFNVLLYSFQDRAPWAVPFIIQRLVDPAWAPVFTDDYAIVFVRRNEQNAALIKKFEIPKDRFGVQKAS